ncbi:zinc finger C3HC-type protein 1 [Aplochiton taeniatus]
MATLGSRGDRVASSNHQTNSAFASPEKVRELLNEGLVSLDSRSNGLQGDFGVIEPNGITQAPCEASNKEAFFARVETYTCLRWAGKPQSLSPLRCASYGWVNMGCDMLKCSGCQAFLCVSLQPTLNFRKYETRITEIAKQLQTQHEQFCPWPEFPCPDRFWLVPADEPSELLSAFLERFQTACLLELQLPAMKPEQIQTMSLTEDVLSVLLQLIEEEQKKQGKTPSSESLTVQVAACIASLCGWAASPTMHAMNLPILTCSFCMRKVGLWNFYQMEGTAGEGDSFLNTPTPSMLTPSTAYVIAHEGQGGRSTPTFHSPSPTPCRMKLRSQDTSRSDQAEGTPSPLLSRTRSRDSPSPNEEMPSPLTRGKRISTRSRGQGEGACGEGTVSPQHYPKRLRLSSVSYPDSSVHKNVFDPLGQHRDWCPWINSGKENIKPGDIPLIDRDSEHHQPGWKAALSLLLPMRKKCSPVENSPSQDPHDKSKKVFAIFRQWQVSSPSQ